MLDDKNGRPRFRASNYQSTTRVKPFICTMSMRLDEGWNQIQFNLSDFTRRAYGTNNIETLRVQIHAKCRVRRIYFSDRLYSEEELPPEFKLLLPITKNLENSTRNIAQKPGKTLKSTNEESIPVSLNEEKSQKKKTSRANESMKRRKMTWPSKAVIRNNQRDCL